MHTLLQSSSTLFQNRLLHLGIILFILAILDALFTDIGIKNQLITESNPIMRKIYNMSVTGFYIIKIALPILLIGIITKLEKTQFIVFLLNAAILIYVSVILLHFYWLTIAFANG